MDGLVRGEVVASKALSSQQKKLLLEQVTLAQATNESYIRMISDAGLLAVNQVQDKRIELLEQGPEVSTSDLAFDLLLATCLSPAAGRLLETVTATVFNRVLTTRGVFMSIGYKSKVGARVYEQVAMSGLPHLGINDLQKAFLRSHSAKDLYDDVVYNMVDRSTGVLGETAKTGHKIATKKKQAQLPRDSAGVSVLDSALEFRRRQLAATSIYFQDFRDKIYLDIVRSKDAPGVLANLAQYSKPLPGRLDPGRAKQYYKSFFEFCIWTELLEMRSWGGRTRSYEMEVAPLGSTSYQTREAFGYYMTTRILDPKTMKPFFNGTSKEYGARRSWSKATLKEYSLDALWQSWYKGIRPTIRGLNENKPLIDMLTNSTLKTPRED